MIMMNNKLKMDYNFNYLKKIVNLFKIKIKLIIRSRYKVEQVAPEMDFLKLKNFWIKNLINKLAVIVTIIII